MKKPFKILINSRCFMGILVKGEITITKGFKTWKEMVYAQDGKLKEHGIKFVFAGTQKDDKKLQH